MSKKMVFTLLSLLAYGIMMANSAVEVGFYNPKDSKTSFIFGYEKHADVDERVTILFSSNFFYRSFTEDRSIGIVGDGNSSTVTVKRSSELKTYYLPFLIGGRVSFPEITPNPFIGGGVGWGIAWESVYIAKTGEMLKSIDDVKFYNGFTWQINTGAQYPLGSKTDVYVKLFYNGSTLSRDRKKTDTGITWDEINMSGLGLSLGLKLKF